MRLYEWLTWIFVLWIVIVGLYLAGRWYNRTSFDLERVEMHVNWDVLHLPGETYYIHFIVTDGFSYRAWGKEL